MNVQRRRLDRLEARLGAGQMPVLVAFLPSSLDEDDRRADVARLADQERIKTPFETMIIERNDGSAARAEVVADFDGLLRKVARGSRPNWRYSCWQRRDSVSRAGVGAPTFGRV